MPPMRRKVYTRPGCLQSNDFAPLVDPILLCFARSWIEDGKPRTGCNPVSGFH